MSYTVQPDDFDFSKSINTKIFEVEDRIVSLPQIVDQKANEQIEQFISELSKKGQSCEHHAKYRNTNARKAADDHRLGKKAEIFAAWYLGHNKGFPLSKIVHFEIRKGRSKGWGADLPYAEKVDKRLPNVHVKSCSKRTADRWGCTWTVQLSDRTGFGMDKTFLSGPDDDLVVFVYLDDYKSSQATIKAIVPCSEARKLLKLPMLEKYHGKKVSIYYNDLVDLMQKRSTVA